ncbi:aminopeptidase P family protein [Hyphobacterium marinum]|uniref:Aminopeptidase P family protein n=1 Tax=Hyphobacterium marinum TaxID=3116574 RepID=A0ABU7LWU7_9PROT|nr:aminopeptidase P family protein [Hyphobacterium sp. Y6023]MEE2566039.1 aminopeptidase P family protein [Hyphobacterium sp. Y6023]
MTQFKPQSFDVKGGPQVGRAHLPLLRDALAEAGLDGFVIPHEDEYNNEYLPDCNERLSWATGFTGSAGAAVVLTGKAAVFADGRYTVQVREQVDASIFEIQDLIETPPYDWVGKNAPKGAKIGYDPKLHSPDALDHFHRAARKAGAEMVAVETNPIDTAWQDRPAPPAAQVHPHPIEFAGEDHASKRSRVGEAIAEDGADAAAITAPPSLAWLFNLRGGDVARSPLALGAAILNADGTATLYMDPEKLTDEARSHLGNEVAIRPEAEFAAGLAELKGKAVSVDPAQSSAWVFDRLQAAGATVKRRRDPVALPKAIKNSTEIGGARKAHVRDGAALTRFLHWLDTEAQSGEVNEIEAAIKLAEFRGELTDLKDLSFDTISGFGKNGALPHYRVSEASNLKLARGSLYLVDSGGQYPDGTTDVTRTVPIGEPTAEMRRRFTLVLKGHIALSTARFPRGTSGGQLDTLARLPLWMNGLDYDHGTGHGVGSFLGVHEGPQRIAKAGSSEPLKPGMIVSNEPGYYKEQEYGIRIENLIVVTELAPAGDGDRAMMGFENLTLAPIHRGLIDLDILTREERAWVDAYHADVLAKLGPKLSGETAEWLNAACAPL